MKKHVLFALLPLLAACSPDFDKSSQVQKLRLLAEQAEPPEIAPLASTPDPKAPPDRASLDVLVGHPAFVSDPARRTTVVHLACTPSLDDVIGTVCTTLSQLANPEQILTYADPAAACTSPGVGLAGGVTFSGVQSCGPQGCEPAVILRDPSDPASALTLPTASYVLPAGLTLDALPTGNAQRILGIDVVALALLLDASPDELAPSSAAVDPCAALSAFLQSFLAAWPNREHVAGVKRVHVRGPDATDDPNLNPAIDSITLSDGSPFPAQLAPDAVLELLPVLPPVPAGSADLHQTYVRRDANGAPISQETEQFTISWFATDGDFHDLHSLETEPEKWTAPASPPPAPASGRIVFYTVIHDPRGGAAWTRSTLTISP